MRLSDSKQQITPERLIQILPNLKTRNLEFTDELNQGRLGIIREQIDQADQEILEAIAKRLDLVEQIGEFKRENNVAIFQISRWKEIFKSRQRLGKEMDLILNLSLMY